MEDFGVDTVPGIQSLRQRANVVLGRQNSTLVFFLYYTHEYTRI